MASDEGLLSTRPCNRAYLLDDVHVRSDGSGRVVEAYAAVFGKRAEIMDQDGHYNEELAPTSFQRTLHHRKPTDFRVLFNHGMTITGASNPVATMPIGVPLEITPDNVGVFTATEYLQNPLADHVLDGIKKGALRTQSFAGRFTKSIRSYPEGRARGSLPLITRHEVDLREYGPAVFAAYEDAAILGTRSVDLFMRALLATPPELRADFLKDFEGLTTPLADPEALTPGTPPDGGPASADDPTPSHSARLLRERIRVARKQRGME